MSEAVRRKRKLLLRLGVYALLLLLAVGYLILCRYGYGIPCFYLETFGRQCPSCGATRALQALLRFDFEAAVRYNGVFALAVYPIFGLIALQDIAVCIGNLITGRDRLSFLQFLCGKLYHFCNTPRKKRPGGHGAPSNQSGKAGE